MGVLGAGQGACPRTSSLSLRVRVPPMRLSTTLDESSPTPGFALHITRNVFNL